MSETTSIDSLTDILSRIDSQADDAAGMIKNCAEAEAENLLDQALTQLFHKRGGDQVEAWLRSEWLRGEIQRRLPKIGRA